MFLASQMTGIQAHFPGENNFFRNKGDVSDLTNVLLKLPWTNSVVVTELHPPWKAKCLSILILSKIGLSLKSESDLEVLGWGLHDEAEVRMEAVISMPVTVLSSGVSVLTYMFRRLEFLGKERNEKVRNVLPFCLGFLAYLYGTCSAVDVVDNSACKLFTKFEIDKQSLSMDHLLQRFWCSRCDRRVASNHELYLTISYIRLACKLWILERIVISYAYIPSFSSFFSRHQKIFKLHVLK